MTSNEDTGNTVSSLSNINTTISVSSSNINNNNNNNSATAESASSNINNNNSSTAKPVKQKMSTDFVKKLYQMLEIHDYRDVVRWTESGESFVVLDNNEFTKFILPNHFKHSNFASFVRQLNKYDFHKVKQTADDKAAKNYGDSAWEFKHPDFKINNIDALDNIKRKVSSTQRKKLPNNHENNGSTEEIENLNKKLKTLEDATSTLKSDFKILNDRYTDILNSISHFNQISLQYHNSFISLTQSLSASGIKVPNFSFPVITQQQKQQQQHQPTISNMNINRQHHLSHPSTPIHQQSQQQHQVAPAVKLEHNGTNFSHNMHPHSSLTNSHIPLMPQQQAQIINPVGNFSNTNSTSNVAATPSLIHTVVAQNNNTFNTNNSSTISGHSSVSTSTVTPPSLNILGNSSNANNVAGTTTAVNSNSNIITAASTTATSANTATNNKNNDVNNKAITGSPDNSLNNQVVDRTSTVVTATAGGSSSGNNGIAAATITTTNTSEESLDQMNLPPPFTGLFHILLVEDDAVCLQLCRKFLLKYGCTVEIVTDGLSAISVLNKRKYDLVLMDIVMPNLDGASATSIIRNFDSTTPIIAMTSNIDDSDLMAYLRHGMSDILAKPFTRQDLYLILEKHLKKRVPIAQQQQQQQQKHSDSPSSMIGKVSTPTAESNIISNANTHSNGAGDSASPLVNEILDGNLLKKPRIV